MPRATERAMLGCFPVARRPSLSYEEGSTSAASMSVSTASPPTSTASTSSPAFLDDEDALYTDDDEPEPDAGGLSTAIAARRFFPATPGLSNSIVDSVEHPATPSHARDSASNVRVLRRAATSEFPASSAAASSSSSSSSSASATKAHLHDDGMQPVRKVSVSTDAPRADFLKSMVEMVEALGLDPRRHDADLARLHDLLLCYIALNERDALRDILGAFADLMCLLNVTTAAVVDGGEKRNGDEQAGAGR
ncbi:unnamed protein product [Miscanthus lutarioriparius]|uniref:Transcription repressor n=1 Tax=Miscanthus lutarioriparius TaxID=422564 RepID=A0A811MIM2_9POAL|nr:unnamed protein product [Miscanthus lutarioriparius]